MAAKAIAGQDQRAAAQGLHRAIGPLVTNADHLVTGIEPKLPDQGVGHDGQVRRRSGLLQAGHQPGAGFFRDGMHAVPAVAGVEKVVQQHKVQPMVGLQRIQHRANRLGIGANQVRCRCAMRLGLNVGRKTLRTVVDAMRLLHTRAGCGHKARGQRG